MLYCVYVPHTFFYNLFLETWTTRLPNKFYVFVLQKYNGIYGNPPYLYFHFYNLYQCFRGPRVIRIWTAGSLRGRPQSEVPKFSTRPASIKPLIAWRDRVMMSHNACTSGTSRVLTVASLQRLKLEALIPAPVDYVKTV